MEDVGENVDESKAPGSGKSWFAVAADMFEHPIVGVHVRTPKPADPSRDAWQPMLAWQWLIKEAARHDRVTTIGSHSVALKRGQLAASQRYLARRFNWGHKAVREFLTRLARHGMVETTCDRIEFKTGTAKGTALTVVSIRNYGTYQPDARQRGTAKGTAGAQQGHSRGTKEYRDTGIQIGKGDARAGANYWTQALNPPRDVLRDESGKLTLLNGMHAEWLATFDGDEKRLDLALKQAAQFVQPHGPHSLETQVHAQLSRIAGQKLDSDKRHAATVAARQQSPPNNETARERKIRQAAEFRAKYIDKTEAERQ